MIPINFIDVINVAGMIFQLNHKKPSKNYTAFNREFLISYSRCSGPRKENRCWDKLFIYDNYILHGAGVGGIIKIIKYSYKWYYVMGSHDHQRSEETRDIKEESFVITFTSKIG